MTEKSFMGLAPSVVIDYKFFKETLVHKGNFGFRVIKKFIWTILNLWTLSELIKSIYYMNYTKYMGFIYIINFYNVYDPY